MQGLGDRLRQRARLLGLSDAEVARRAGLGERRFAHYVTDAREPDFLTLVRICTVLGLTPNEALGWAEITVLGDERDRLMTRLQSITGTLDDRELRATIAVAEALSRELNNA